MKEELKNLKVQYQHEIDSSRVTAFIAGPVLLPLLGFSLYLHYWPGVIGVAILFLLFGLANWYFRKTSQDYARQIHIKVDTRIENMADLQTELGYALKRTLAGKRPFGSYLIYGLPESELVTELENLVRRQADAEVDLSQIVDDIVSIMLIVSIQLSKLPKEYELP